MGNVTIGNPEFFLGRVFELVRNSQEAQKYLFLNTIREIIIADSRCLEDYMFELTELLMMHTSAESQQIRNIVAEILGRLLADFPTETFDTVDSGLKSNNELQAATTARSIKFAGTRLKDVNTVKFLTNQLVQMCGASNVEVKKNALEALTSIVHSNWVSMRTHLRDSMSHILAFALQETKTRPELIHEVDLGPFKHKVDNGLPMRKAAFGLLETLIEKAYESIDASSVLVAIITVGLSDSAEECVVLNLNILAKMSQNSTAVIISYLDQIVAAFNTLFTNNLKLIASSQSQERAINIVRALLRVVYLVNKSPEIQEFPSVTFSDFIKN